MLVCIMWGNCWFSVEVGIQRGAGLVTHVLSSSALSAFYKQYLYMQICRFSNFLLQEELQITIFLLAGVKVNN